MPNVGRPNNNPSRMEPRSVSVAQDKPRINDERKVRPHAAGEPPMGVRPNHPGAQKAPIAPPDTLNAEYIQARDVSMATMTEAELAEWNPFARSKPQSGPSIEDLSAKVSKLEAGMARMHQDRNQMVMQISQLMRSVNPNTPAAPSGHPLRRQMGMNGSTPQAAPEAPAPATATVQRQERGYSTPEPKPFENNKRQWDKRTGKTSTVDGPGDPDLNRLRQKVQNEMPQAAPPSAPTEPRSGYQDLGSGGTGPNEMKNLLRRVGYSDQVLSTMTPYQLERAYSKITTGGEKRKRSTGGVHEGYPDKNYERTEPTHSSRIGDLGGKGKAHSPNPPRDNREFMQAREISVERVHENADREMDDLIAQTLHRMGLGEAFPPDDHFVGQPRDTIPGSSEFKDKIAHSHQPTIPHRPLGAGPHRDPRGDFGHRPGERTKHTPFENTEYTGRASMRGPAGAAPVSETKLPRARARWV